MPGSDKIPSSPPSLLRVAAKSLSAIEFGINRRGGSPIRTSARKTRAAVPCIAVASRLFHHIWTDHEFPRNSWRWKHVQRREDCDQYPWNNDQTAVSYRNNVIFLLPARNAGKKVLDSSTYKWYSVFNEGAVIIVAKSPESLYGLRRIARNFYQKALFHQAKKPFSR
jgi:hypothetical protein